MWLIVVVLAVSTLIALKEVPALLRNKMRRELAVFIVLLLAGTVVSIMRVLRLNIPNPVELIITLFKPVSDFVFQLLK